MYLNTHSLKYFTIISILTIMLLPGCATNTPVYIGSKNAETEIYHYAEKGETIYDIATLYGRSYLEIAKWNNLSPPYRIEEHLKLLVSGPPSLQESPYIVETTPIAPFEPVVPRRLKPAKKASSTPKRSATSSTSAAKPGLASTPLTLKKSGKTYHKVQRGETLYSIAKHYSQNYHDVANWNNLSFPFDLTLGRELLVSPPASSATARRDKATATVLAPKPKLAGKLAGKYVVQPHDTLYSVAKRAGYSMADIMAWNDLQSRDLTIGQTLIVGPPTSSSFIPTQATGTANYHTIVLGDTVYNLSQRYGYSVEQIVQWNNLSPSYNLSRGQRVRVSPPNKVVAQKWASKTTNACYKVGPKETLYSISKNFGYEVADVAKWNGIPSPYTLKIGQSLRMSPATGADSCY